MNVDFKYFLIEIFFLVISLPLWIFVKIICLKSNIDFLSLSHNRNWNFLELIHFDTWEALTVSLGGNSYFVTFVDDNSQNVWVYMLKSKSDIFKKLRHFKAGIENKKNLKIKYLHTDNGGEFCSKKFKAFCNEHRIKRYLIVLEIPQQNDVAKRMNMILMEHPRSMLR